MAIDMFDQDLSNDSESQLCVPDDNLDDLDFFPNFFDDLIKLTEFVEPEPVPMPAPRDSFYRNRVVLHKPEAFLSRPSRAKRRRKGMVERRRCSHCDAEKTPQWREGPNGPNSLCNACGVRYKSGRLVPEYRPAASPSFDRRKHSNFHKKILSKAWQDDYDDGEVLNG
ncbi:GATA-binding factor 2 [Castilleja foliolosa]|uniref:GATA-binding factor 2 n=1 Tax=Castilleja foliolosa TaxID=1961234 RepID=A0ABD3CLW9_9LAMI